MNFRSLVHLRRSIGLNSIDSIWSFDAISGSRLHCRCDDGCINSSAAAETYLHGSVETGCNQGEPNVKFSINNCSTFIGGCLVPLADAVSVSNQLIGLSKQS
jgi:hypothetical protein